VIRLRRKAEWSADATGPTDRQAPAPANPAPANTETGSSQVQDMRW